MAEETKHEEGDVLKKTWRVGPITLRPIFEVIEAQDETKKQDVRCVKVGIQIDAPEGEKQQDEVILEFDQLYQFVYFCASEEIRRDLMQVVMRPVTYVPYDVSFKLSGEEMKTGVANRRVELPVDAITMALARMYGWEAFTRSKFGQGSFKEWYSRMTAQMKAASVKPQVLTKGGG